MSGLSWAGVVPVLLLGYVEGRPEGQRMARTELAKMARVADCAQAMLEALQLSEGNLSSLIAAKHHDAVTMTAWREAVRAAIATAAAA